MQGSGAVCGVTLDCGVDAAAVAGCCGVPAGAAGAAAGGAEFCAKPDCAVAISNRKHNVMRVEPRDEPAIKRRINSESRKKFCCSASGHKDSGSLEPWGENKK